MADGVVRRGYLTLHRNKGGRFPLSTLSSKRMWMVLCREGPGGQGRPRIEMYRSEDNVTGCQPLRVIDLETIRSIKPVERKKGFLIELLDETMMLQCTSKADMEDWVRDMNRLRGGRVDLASGQNMAEFPTGHDIYEAIPDDEVFRVNLRENEAMTFSGPCYLEILRDFATNRFHLALKTKDKPSRLIVQWQIDHIRQYGSNSSAFKFQSGGKSSTGVGWFILETEVGAAQRIHKAVDYWAKYIVDQVKSAQQTHRLQHAPSAPSAQAPPKPPPPTAISSSLISSSVGAYAPLNMDTRDEQSVYQKPSPARAGGRTAPPLRPSRGGVRGDGGSSGVYQPLGKKDDTSTYTAVQRGSGHSPTPPTEEAVYMGLREETREKDQQSTYAIPGQQ